jgi:competence protein ComEC
MAAFALGILLEHVAAWGFAETIGAALAFVALAVWAQWRARGLALPCTLLALVFVGILEARMHQPAPPPKLDAGPEEVVLLDGCVVDPPMLSAGRDQFTIELARGARARVSLAAAPGTPPLELHYGQRIEIEAKARVPRNFDNPGGFDYAGFLARQQTFWNATMVTGTKPKLAGDGCGSRFYRVSFAVREFAMERLEKLYSHDELARGLLEAILLGQRQQLDRVWQDDFRRAGTYHVLVIAGLHLAAFTGFLLLLLRLFFVPRMQALAISTVSAWAYAAVSGFHTPVVRAAAGFTLYAAARYLSRRTRLLNLVAAIALAFLVFDPTQLFEPAFQLSFLAVVSIAVLAAPVIERTSGPYLDGLRNLTSVSRDFHLAPKVASWRVELRLLSLTASLYWKAPRHAAERALEFLLRPPLVGWELFVVSAAMQAGLALPMTYYFHRVSASGVSANVLVVPLMSLVVPFGLLAVLTGARWAAVPAGWLVTAAARISVWHAHVGPDWRVPDPPLWLAAAFAASLAAMALALGWERVRTRRTPKWAAGASVALCLVLLLWHPMRPAVLRGMLELTAIDVGQGDSLLVAFPDGRLMLVDGGGFASFRGTSTPQFDVGEEVVAPYLWERAIRSVDVMVMTHAHADHASGLLALMDDFHPRELWMGASPANPLSRMLVAHARRLGIRVLHPRAGCSYPFGAARVSVLAPALDYQPADAPGNDDSLVLRITFGERTFLLTGDAEAPVESEMLANGDRLRADVLKVGHHGSRTSTTEDFLDAVHPAFAIISDGINNPFHHPHPDVIARLAAHHVEALRTDRLGLITVRTNGHSIRVWDARDDGAGQVLPP